MNHSAFSIGRTVSGGEKRRSLRRGVCWNGLIFDDQGRIITQCFMMDVSASGAKLVLDAGINVGIVCSDMARNAAVRRNCEVVWRSHEHRSSALWGKRTTGHATTVPPSAQLAASSSEGDLVSAQTSALIKAETGLITANEAQADVRFGQKPTFAVQNAISAMPPRADIARAVSCG